MNYNMTLEQFLEQLEFCLMYGPPCGDCPGIDAYPACADMILDKYNIIATKKKETNIAKGV